MSTSSSSAANSRPTLRRRLAFEALEPRILFDAAPEVSVAVADGLTVASDQLVNDDINFSITFDNTGDEVGYAPYVDFLAPPEMEINSVTVAGTTATNPNGTAIQPIGEIGADGQLIQLGTSASPVYINHPMFEPTVGIPPENYYGGAGSGTEPVFYDVVSHPDWIGQYVYSVELPFGSYTQNNPALNILVNASLNTADGVIPSQHYGILARGGFALGADPLDNPGTLETPNDAPIFGSLDSASIIPLVMQLTKTASVPEMDGPYTGELASGPNHPVTYTLRVDVANGETVTNLDLTDVFPGDLAYLGDLTVTDGSGNPVAYTVNSQPLLNTDGLTGTPAANRTLSITFPSVTGVNGTDLIVTYRAFAAYQEGDAGGAVINPTTGEEVDQAPYNDARIDGTWNGHAVYDDEGPAGSSQDGITGDLETDFVIEEHSLAIQKGVSVAVDRDATGVSPTDVLEYTMNFQVSDYFAFTHLEVTDELGDGQDFLPGDGRSGFEIDAQEMVPQLRFTQHGVTITVDFDPENYTAVVNPDGSTTMVFDVWSQLQADFESIAEGGVVLGGLIPESGTSSPNPATFNGGATTGTITYRVRVRDSYTNIGSQPELSQGDALTNSVSITGTNLNIQTLAPTGSSVTDGSGTSLHMPIGAIEKDVVAITSHGQTTMEPPSTMPVSPGDLVTYRIRYQLPLSEFENLRFEDFLPLPIFDVSEIDASQIYAYDSELSYNTAGRISWGPNDTFFGSQGPGATGDGGLDDDPMYPTLSTLSPSIDKTTNSSTNGFIVNIGSYEVGTAPSAGRVLEFYVTVRVNDADFADRLQFTNQVGSFESNTFGEEDVDDDFVQTIFTQPELTLTKGVIASTNVNSELAASAPAGVTFTAGGSGETAFTGTINSSNLESGNVNADLTDADAGDIVTFMIVVENAGTSGYGAFDVVIKDTVPTGFAAGSGGYNLRVTDGAGNALAYTGDLFAGGITLTDPSETQGAVGAHHATNGSNIVVITYELEVSNEVFDDVSLTNTATLEGYAAYEGGFQREGNTDTADVSITDLTIEKTIIGTSQTTASNSAGEATIGEIITYEVMVTIPEGDRTDFRVTDLLDTGLAFVDFLGIFQVSSGLSALESLTFVEAIISNDGRQLDLGFNGTPGLGTLFNTNRDNTTTETFTFRYRAVVLNSVGIGNGDVLTNTVSAIYAGSSGDTTVSDTDAGVTVIEPNVTVTKSVDKPEAMPDEMVTYTIVITNNGSAEAYDVDLLDALPDEIKGATNLRVIDGVEPDSYSLNSGIGEGRIEAFWSSLAVGQSVTLAIDVTVDTGLLVRQIVTNTAEITYTSLPGDPGTISSHHSDATERSGSGDPANSYSDDDDASFTVPSPSPGKAIIDTAEAHTTHDSSASGTVMAAVGEVVRYQITIVVPQGTMNSLTLVDTLGAGLRFIDKSINNVTVQLNGFESDGSTVVSPNIPSGALTGPAALDSSYITVNGNIISFDLGSIQNTETDSSAIESITLSYNVIVMNSVGVEAGDILTNSAQVQVDGTDAGDPATISVTVLEPHISIDVADATTTADAGDTITYTLTVTNANHAYSTTGFDLNIEDLIPDELEITSLSFQNLPVYVTSSSVNDTGQTVNGYVNELREGDSFQILIQVRVRDTGADIIKAAQTISNSATVDYSSLPGDGTDNGSGDNTTGNDSGTPGDTDGERLYDDDDSDSFTSPSPTITKVLDNPADTTFTIGEEVEYVITITVPEGTTQDVVLTDVLAAGMTYVSGSLSVTAGSGLTVETGGSLNDANGSFYGRATTGDTASETMTLTFGDVVFNEGGAGNGLGTQTIVVRYRAVVDNILLNQNAQTRTSVADLHWTNGQGSSIDTDDSTPDSDTTVSIVEPDLTVTHTITTSTAGVDAADRVAFQLTIAHSGSSTANAYNLIVGADLPDGVLRNLTITSAMIGSTDVSSLLSIDGSNNLVTTGTLDLAMGQTLVIAFQGLVKDDANPGDSIESIAGLTWTGISGANSGERTGADGAGNVLNNYANSATVSTPVDGALTVTKSVVGGITEVLIDDDITYQLEVAVSEGTIENFQIVDTIPAGVTVDLDTLSVTGLGGMTINGFNAVLNGQVLTITATSILNPGNVNVTTAIETDTFYITYDAHINDVVGNYNTVVLTNDADATAGGGLSDLNNQASVTVSEPVLALDKSFNTGSPTSGDAGTVATYLFTINHTAASRADAQDVVLTDVIPAGFRYVPGSLALVNGTLPTITISGTGTGIAGETITLRWETIPETVLAANSYRVTMQFTVVDEITDNSANILNSATIHWDQDPDDLSGRDASTSDSAPAFDPDLSYALAKTVVDTSIAATGASQGNVSYQDLVIGEEVTFEITATFGEGTTTDVIITDTLPYITATGTAGGSLQIVSSTLHAIGAGITSISTGLTAGTAGTSGGSNPDIVSWNLGTVLAEGDNVANNTVTFRVVARVVNTAPNQNADVLTNTAELSVYSGGQTQTSSATASVDLVEPDLNVATTITSSTVGLDAGDTFTYQIQVTHTGSSRANAYDLNLIDALPDVILDGVFISSATLNGVDVLSSFDLDGDGDLLTDGDVDLPLGQTLTITIQGTLRNDVNPGDTISSAPTLTWTSINGTSSYERDGSGGVNDYSDTASTSTTVDASLNLTKTAVGGITEVIVGQTITYQLEVNVSEGMLENLTIVDTLPSGVTYVAHSAQVSNANGLTLNTAAFNVTGNTLTFTAASVVNNSPGNSPSTLETRSFFITYQVTVDDEAGVYNGVQLVNDADASATGVSPDNNNVVTLTVVEPVLEMTKDLASGSATTGDAGDVFTYHFTLNHADDSAADAYDVTLADIIQAGYEYVSGSLTAVGAAPTPDAVTISGTGEGVAGETITLRWEHIPLGAAAYEYTIQFRIVDTITDSSPDIVNSATLNYDNWADDSLGRAATPVVDSAAIVDPDLAYAFTKSVVSTSATHTTGTELTIGEEVVFELVATFGEGTTNNVSIQDILPYLNINNTTGGTLEYVSSYIHAMGAGITSVGNDLEVGSEGTVSGANSDTITWDFGTVVAAGNNTADSTITIRIVARVANTAPNQDGDTLTNNATLSIDSGTQTFSDDAVVTVVEPDLSVNTNFEGDLSGLDAGDTVTIKIEVRHTGNSHADAFEVGLTNSLPSGQLENFSLVSAVIGSTNVASNFTLGANQLTTNSGFDLAEGEVLTIYVTGKVRDDANPREWVESEGQITWSSLNGEDEFERDGEGGVDNYDDNDFDDTEIVGVLNLTKTAPSVTEVRVGDTVTYQLQLTVAEGTLENLTIVDTLPTGTTYVPGSAVVSNANGMTVTGFDVEENDGVLTFTATSVLNPGNTDDLDTLDTDSFYITYQVTVDDHASVTNGAELVNNADASADDVDPDEDNEVTLTVIEPVLEFTKDLDDSSPTTGDAGDVFTYVFTVNHGAASTSDAFDVEIADLIPAGYEYVSSSISAQGTTPAPDSVTISGTGVGIAGETITIRWESIPEGADDYVVHIQFRLVDSITDSHSDITNSATLTYDSHPDDTLGRAGTPIVDSAAIVNPDLAYAFTKSVVSTSATHTAGTEMTIGEEVIFELVATFGEGTTNGVSIQDILPYLNLNDTTGGTLEYVSSTIYAMGAGITSVGNGLDVGSEGTVSGANSDTITWNFGTVVAAGNNTADSTITVRIVARVANTTPTQDGDTLTNNATLSIDSGTQTFSDDAAVTVVEPDLQVTTTIEGDVSGLEAGDTVTFKVEVRHTSNSHADAFDLDLTSDLPEHLMEGFSLVSAVIGSTDVAGNFTLGAGSLTTGTRFDLAEGEVLTIYITGTVRDGANPQDNLESEGRVTWSSLNGDQDGERDGEGGVDDYEDVDSDDTSIHGVLNLTKTAPGVTEVRVGDTVTYNLQITVAEGTLENLTIVDTLPTGASYVPGSAVVFDANGMTVTGFDVEENDGILTLTATSVLNPGNTDAPDSLDTGSFTITYQVTIDDHASVTNGAELINSADASADSVDPDEDNEVTLTVIEPVLEFTKDLDDASPTTGDAGDVFTYVFTVNHGAASTSDAFDVEIADLIPAGYEYVSSSISAQGTTPAPSVTISGTGVGVAGETITLRWESIPEGADDYVVSIQFRLVDSITDQDADITNSATLTYDSHPDDTLGRAGTPIVDSAPIVDPNLAYAFTKSVIATSETATTGTNLAVGEEVTFELVVTLGEGTTTGVTLTDILPYTLLSDGSGTLEYVSSEIHAIGAGITSIGNGLTTGSAGTVSGANSDTITWDFGTIVAAGNNTADSTITIRIVARAVNVAANQTGDTLTNNATLSLYGGNQTLSDDAAVSVVEPALSISTQVVNDTSGLDAGDTVTWEIEIAHTVGSTGTAFDLILTDVLPDDLMENFSIVSALIGATDVSSAFSIDSDNELTNTKLDLAQGQTLTIRLTGTVRNAANPTDLIQHTAGVAWTSIDGTNSYERDGSGGVNDYITTDHADAYVTGVLGLEKTVQAVTEVRVGDTITYQLAVTVGEGTLPNLSIVDTLPVGTTYVPGSATVSDANGMTVSSFAANVASGVLTITATSVLNPAGSDDSDTLETDTFYITYQVTIDDHAAVVDGAVLTNTADASADGVDPDEDNEASVTVIEPVLEFTKDLDASSPTTGDAGDVMTYVFTLNHASASTSDAFDVVISDTIPAGYEYVASSITMLDGTPAPDAVNTVNGEAGDTITLRWETIALDADTFRVSIQFRLVDSITDLDADITNSASLDYDSHPDDTLGRAGEPITDSAAIVDPNLAYAFTKSVVATSSSHTTDALGDTDIADLVIGEEVTFELVATFGEGTTTGVTLTDLLPFTSNLGDGLGVLELVSSEIYSIGAGITSIGNSLTVGSAGTVSGTNSETITWDLGTVVAAGNNTAGDTQIVFRVVARVANVAQNQDGDLLTNNATLSIYSGDQSLSDYAAVEVFEPAVTVAKSITDQPAEPDSGDTVSYQVVITNTGDLATYDVNILDALPAEILLQTGTFTATSNQNGDVSAWFQATATGVTQSGTGFTLAVGEVITITYDVLLTGAVVDGTDYTNEVDIEWTSLEGDVTGERGGDGTGANDYTDGDTATFTTEVSDTFAFSKTVLSTSASHTSSDGGTDSDLVDLVVGETVTYRLVATIGNGTTDNVRVVDSLAVLNGLLHIENISITAGSNLSSSLGDITTLVPELNDPNTDTYLDEMILQLGTMTNTGTSTVLADNQIVVLVTARVVNAAANQESDVITNTGTIYYESSGGELSASDSVDVELLEPVFTIDKSVDNTAVKLGDILTYTVTITNQTGTTGAQGFDLVVNDLLPPGLTMDLGSISMSHSGTGNEPVITFDDSTVSNLRLYLDQLAMGDTITITYQATVTVAHEFWDAQLTNTAAVTWTSIEGTNSTERGGDSTEAHDDYRVEDSQMVEVFQPDLSIVKSDGGTFFKAGTEVTYTLTVTNIGRGEALTVSVTDDLTQWLAQGFTFVGGSHGATILNGIVTFTLPDMPVSAVEIITLTLRAPSVVPAGLEFITNTATVTQWDEDPTPDNNTSFDETPIDAAPDLRITKTDKLTRATVGDTITYTITYTNDGDQIARDVVLTDKLPDGVDFERASRGGHRIGNNVIWNLGDLEPGQSGTVTVTVTLVEDGVILNSAFIEDDGTSGEDPTPSNNKAQDRTEADPLPLESREARMRSRLVALGIDYLNLRFDVNQNFLFNRFGPTVSDAMADDSGIEFIRYFRMTENLHHRLPTAISHHMNSGLVQAGSTVTLEVYNRQGRLIAESSSVADAGGNWLITFQNASVEEEPHQIVMRQESAVYNQDVDSGFNFRTYFGPAYNTGTYYSGQLTVQSIFNERSASSVLELYRASGAMFSLQWNNYTYEFVAISGLPGLTGQ